MATIHHAGRRTELRPIAAALATTALILGGLAGPASAAGPLPPLPPPPQFEPIDPQNVTQAADQTWADYHPIPGSPYADNSIEPSILRWNVALILTDFPGTPFAVTQPQGSTIFGNPGPAAHDLPRDAVPAFYRDWMNVPSAANNYQGMNRYWMEDSFGRYGVNLEGFGPYQLPGSQDDYFITDFTSNSYCNTQTRTTTAQTAVTDVEVVSSASFPVGKIVTGLSGSRVILEKPDATHLRTGGATTMSADAVIGATNIKVGSVAGMAVGDTIQIGYDDRLETRTITSVGTTGGSGSGVDVDPALAFGHARNTIVRDQVATPINVSANAFVHSCNRNYRTDTVVAWSDHVSATDRAAFSNSFYVAAGQDESGTWQEFGEMQFTGGPGAVDTVPDAFGPPNPEIPQNWAGTRYIPWTSWASAATIWPNASGNNSVEGEGSGMAVYAHELSHNLGLPDNYNNPYASPFQRTATGYLNMMSRGSFGGPGGTHTRYNIPGTMGTALGSQHTMRDKIALNFATSSNFVDLNRNGLATSGLAVVDVTARESAPTETEQSAVRINFDGSSPVDKNVSCTVFTTALAAPAAKGDTTIKVVSVTNIAVGTQILVGDRGNDEVVTVESVGTAGAEGTGVTLAAPLGLDQPDGATVSNRLMCSGNANFSNYVVEVVQQIGSDSFQADSGVMITKTKNSSGSCGSFSCRVWTIDANPTDINLDDFVRPDGSVQVVTTGDPRQLSDALFHAGTDSGSQYEWEDTRNGLHFYILARTIDADGVMHYTVAVQNINGSGPHVRGASVADAAPVAPAALGGYCSFPLTNTGSFESFTNPHPEDVDAFVNRDVYRLSASATGDGWTAELPNALATAAFGETVNVPVYFSHTADSAPTGHVSLTATSVSDTNQTSTADCTIDFTAMAVLGAVQDEIGQASEGADKKDAHKLDEAYKKLGEALDPKSWTSDNTLDPKDGKKVFDKDKEAVNQLEQLLKDKKSQIADETLQGWIDWIVFVDRRLASDAIDTAQTTPGADVKKIDDATKKLGEGDTRAADGKYHEAIDSYRESWQKATEAIKKVGP
jgi:M6 family metalloprotease-like protein